MKPSSLALALVATAGLAACESHFQPPPAGPVLGAPIQSPPQTWTWVDFPDTACDDGSPTGLALNRTESKNVLIFLMGGGACWEYNTCFVLNTASHGPVGRAEFENTFGQVPQGSIFDRTLAQNPFKDWNLVFVPYCTGDVHGGDNTPTYGPKVYHHSGRPNLVAYLKRLAATWPSPERVVFSGASAGGFGSAMNYDLFRTYFPSGKAYLLDDSGPPLIGDDIARSLRAAWYSSWGLSRTLGSFCPECEDDFSSMIPLLMKKYPGDRMALLSSLQDETIRGFYLQSGADFQTNLLRLASERIDATTNLRYFFESGEHHTMVAEPDKHITRGVNLWTWLGQMVHDDPAWTSIKP